MTIKGSANRVESKANNKVFDFSPHIICIPEVSIILFRMLLYHSSPEFYKLMISSLIFPRFYLDVMIFFVFLQCNGGLDHEPNGLRTRVNA